MKTLAITAVVLLALNACSQEKKQSMDIIPSQEMSNRIKKYKVSKSDAEWKKELSEDEYRILREKGTERAFTGDLLDNKKEGVYTCRACGQQLFESDTKYNSGSGWPSFTDAIKGKVEEDRDVSYGMIRTEIMCDNCGGHLGHVFEDGPGPSGLRYCVNSASLDFEKGEAPAKEE